MRLRPCAPARLILAALLWRTLPPLFQMRNACLVQAPAATPASGSDATRCCIPESGASVEDWFGTAQAFASTCFFVLVFPSLSACPSLGSDVAHACLSCTTRSLPRALDKMVPALNVAFLGLVCLVFVRG